MIFIFLVVDVMSALWVFQSYGRFLYRRNGMSWIYSVEIVKYVNDWWEHFSYVGRFEELIGNPIVILRLVFIFLQVYPFSTHLLRRYWPWDRLRIEVIVQREGSAQLRTFLDKIWFDGALNSLTTCTTSIRTDGSAFLGSGITID
jgi:hypothetical protein